MSALFSTAMWFETTVCVANVANPYLAFYVGDVASGVCVCVCNCSVWPDLPVSVQTFMTIRVCDCVVPGGMTFASCAGEDVAWSELFSSGGRELLTSSAHALTTSTAHVSCRHILCNYASVSNSCVLCMQGHSCEDLCSYRQSSDQVKYYYTSWLCNNYASLLQGLMCLYYYLILLYCRSSPRNRWRLSILPRCPSLQCDVHE